MKVDKDLIAKYQKKWIDIQTTQVSDQEIIDVVGGVWVHMGYKKPNVTVFDSPIQCKRNDKEKTHQPYWNIWLCSYAATYEYAKEMGVSFPEDNYDLFLEWARCCPFVLFTETDVMASRRPVELHLDDQNRLHNEDGPASRYKDGWSIWVINGVTVDEQIVMSPETQTVKQILDETNEEVRVIRLERYGYEKFFKEIGSVVLDERDNDIEGTKEFLVKGGGISALLCVCPSTNKRFVLQVPTTVGTCKAAQSWLSNGLSDRIISAS